jgi:hypothetical protein
VNSSAGNFPTVVLKSRTTWLCAAAMIGLAAVTAPSVAQAQAQCPSPPPIQIPPPNLSPPTATVVPADACIPSSATTAQAFAYFDDYSWRAFIAMVWPALSGQRGVPDVSKPLTAGSPLVFETLKADWETFQPNGTPPSDFNSTDSYWGSNPSQAPCPSAKPGDFLLAPVTKFGNVGLAGFGNLVSVLMAQNDTFVRYLAAYNQTTFNQIQSGQLYLAKNVVGISITFNKGALDVKSAWIDMTNIPHPERYYTRPAWLVDPISGKCSTSQVTVGLVGLHIVQKTPTRPQWIWSTFEQVDSVPPANYVPSNPPSQTFTFNDGTATPMPSSIPPDWVWSKAQQAANPPPPHNIQRLTAVNTSTVATNGIWQSALQAQNSVWQYYQLTMTQWPTPPSTPSDSGAPGFTVPGTTAGNPQPISAFANPVLETFFQTKVRDGCMACHNNVQKNDFVFSLVMNAYSPPQITAAARRQSPALQGLRALLRDQFK